LPTSRWAGWRPPSPCTTPWKRTSAALRPRFIRRSDKALLRFPGSAVHQEVAKTVAVLQILGNMPVTVQNVPA
jgi:hypothetical protein